MIVRYVLSCLTRRLINRDVRPLVISQEDRQETEVLFITGIIIVNIMIALSVRVKHFRLFRKTSSIAKFDKTIAVLPTYYLTSESGSTVVPWKKCVFDNPATICSSLGQNSKYYWMENKM